MSEKNNIDKDREEKEAMPIGTILETLDQLIKKLEEPSLPLEEGMRLYKEGVELTRLCAGRLDAMEQKMLEISEDGTYREFQG